MLRSLLTFQNRASLLACLTLASTGYLVFTNKTEGNILNNFPSDHGLVNAARLCFAVNMFLTFPLECFVCREVIWGYFLGHEGGEAGRHGGGPGQDVGQGLHVGVTLALVLSAMGVALGTCDLGFVLEITVSAFVKRSFVWRGYYPDSGF